MNRIVIFVFICILKGSYPLYAQQIIAKRLPFLKQLSSNEIIDIHQDKDGYIWLGTTNGVGRYDGYGIQTFRANLNTPGLLSDNYINCFAENENNLWIGTKKGLNLLDKNTYRIRPFPEEQLQKRSINALLTDKTGETWVAAGRELYRCDSDLSVKKTYSFYSAYLSESGSINSLYEDRKGSIWVLTWGNGLFRYSKETDSFIQFPKIGLENKPFTMLQDTTGRYWIATWGDGLWMFSPDKEPNNMFQKKNIINTKVNVPENIFFSMVQDDTFGYLWILSYFELYAFKLSETGELEKINISSVIDEKKMFSKLQKDRDGNLWLGAYDEGYNIIFEKAKIKNHKIPQIKSDIGFDTNIIALCEDHGGIMWFSQERYGLCLFDKESEQITYGCDNNRSYSIDVGTIIPAATGNDVWAGTRYTGTVYRMGRSGMKMFVKEEIKLYEAISHAGNITHLQEDRRGNLWISTTNHIFVKPANQQQVIVARTNLSGITRIARDSQGNVWISNTESGIYQMKYTDKLVLLNHYPSGGLMQGDKIENICTDISDNLWVSSSQGHLLLFNPQTSRFEDRTEVCGMKGEAILNIVATGKAIWIMTNKELIRYIPGKEGNIRYSTSDENIFVSAFRNGAACVGHSGNFYAGGHGGFISIGEIAGQSDLIAGNSVKITDIKVDNRSLLFMQTPEKVENSVHQVALEAGDRNIEILFSALSYVSNSKIKYAYQLAGIDKDWVYIDGGRRSAFYNRLPKGNYIFKVKSTNRQGEWSKEVTSLAVIMPPAWYETLYAYLVYALIVLSLAYYLIRAYSNRIKLKESLKFQRELTQTKLNYFTNISHELLTPLTIISCVTDNLEMSGKSSEQQISTLRANVSRLKRLLQQILDFRKVESGKMELSVSWGNISAFVANSSRSYFQPLAEKKNIYFSIEVEEDNIWGYLDFDKVDKILFNLLSNAIKYTPEHKNVSLQIDKITKNGHSALIIKVVDEGIGIASKDLDRIFTRFYHNKNHRGSESNGIGLSLTRELVYLHHGFISVSSKLGEGSVFTVELPIDKESYSEGELAEVAHLQETISTFHADEDDSVDKPSLLIIDDNEELLTLMKNVFIGNYRVLTSTNGCEGLRLLKESPSDIIICDVMMPVMDGLEFCRTLKADFATSHIPILMLTAKNTVEDRIECYNAGADGYISKPFELNILYARIENLLRSCQLRREQFRSNTEINISGLEYRSTDEQFLNNAIQCIEKYLAESDFDVVLFASELNVSKSTLNRKIKAMTGLTPLEFIRNIRLKHACMLLKRPSVNISEVAYAVGFSNPKYFAKCFKEEFNRTPSEYQNDK